MIDKIISWINIWLQPSGKTMEFPRLPAIRNAYVIIQIERSKKYKPIKNGRKIRAQQHQARNIAGHMTQAGHLVTNMAGRDSSDYMHPKKACKHTRRPQIPKIKAVLCLNYFLYKLD